jgi:hydroxymethylpyrimidine/phosphomethylpyrimidine kinase
MIANALTIAGSDPSGGAGIQADLKTFSALGVYGCAVMTALTAQNTRAVTGIHAVPPAFIAEQIDTLFADVRVDAVKIGMAGAAAANDVIAERLVAHGARNIVVDPVMVAKSGDRLLPEDAVASVRDRLLPIATVITPNLEEAADLLRRPAALDMAGMRETARALHALGPRYVYLKGGHLGGAESPDVIFDGVAFTELPGVRIATKNTHGTGCTLSSAIAALLAKNTPPLEAFRAAKAWLSDAIRRADELSVGSGHGPVHHFHAVWK